MFSNLKIASKLSLMVGLLLALSVSVAGYGVLALKQAQATTAVSLKMSSSLLLAVDSARAAEVSFKVQVQEFKNILLRGHDQKDFDRYLASFRKRSDQVVKEFQDVQDAFGRLGLPLDVLADARRLHADIVQQYTDALKRFEVDKAETTAIVDAAVRGKDRPLEEKIEAVVTAAEKFAEKESARLTGVAAAETAQAITVLTVAIVLGMAAAILVAATVIRGLARELGGEPAYAKEVARRIAAGDLSLDVQVRAGDRNSMVFAMKQMTENLRSLVGEVAGGAHTVSDTSAQIAQGNTDLSQRTEEQASTLEETASQMEELTTTVTQNAENARQASQLAVTASDVARKGGAVVGEVVQTMNGISDSSRRISDIIGVIDGIAFQTNILALNAAVEAARAGDQGRGFAVVATEVRNLAQRSAAAAKEIKGLIGDSVNKVEAGTRLVDAAGQTMTEIVTSVKKVSDLISEIAAASQEQSAGIEQVNTAVTQMDQVVQQNASLVEEASAATESMKSQARQLLQMVARFRLRDSAANGEFSPMEDSAAAAPAAAAPLQPIRLKASPQRLQPAPGFALASAQPAGANGAWREF